MTDLLGITATISPHAMWLRDHDLIVREYQHPHSLNGSRRFVCANRATTRFAAGDTLEEAEQVFCQREGLTWWKLSDWNAAMAPSCEEEAP